MARECPNGAHAADHETKMLADKGITILLQHINALVVYKQEEAEAFDQHDDPEGQYFTGGLREHAQFATFDSSLNGLVFNTSILDDLAYSSPVVCVAHVIANVSLGGNVASAYPVSLLGCNSPLLPACRADASKTLAGAKLLLTREH